MKQILVKIGDLISFKPRVRCPYFISEEAIDLHEVVYVDNQFGYIEVKWGAKNEDIMNINLNRGDKLLRVYRRVTK